MEDIPNVLFNGFKSVIKNKILFFPAIIITILGSIGRIVLTSSNTPEVYFDFLLENLWTVVLVYLCFSILVFIITAYFTAGRIGMAKEAASTGKTGMKHFFSYGNRFFGRMLAANVIRLLIQSIALIFWIPAFYVIYKSGITANDFINDTLSSPENLISFIFMFFLLVFIASILTLIYGIILYVLFFFVGYNIVVDDLSAIDSYKKSFSLLKEKALQVFLFLLALFAVVIIIGAIAYSVSIFSGLFIIFLMIIFPVLGIIGNILSIILNLIFSMILAVFFTVWITRFYMAITEKPLYVEEKK